MCWESFIIRLDILMRGERARSGQLRIFHYSPWYTYVARRSGSRRVENLSLFALIYLMSCDLRVGCRWESFIIRLDILIFCEIIRKPKLRIFHYSPWYTYLSDRPLLHRVENLSLFALIYLQYWVVRGENGWESFIIRLDILKGQRRPPGFSLRIFHYSPWYTYPPWAIASSSVENLSLFALIYLSRT